MSESKKKIVILGGGMASLTTAHELTDYPGWEEKYEITIYQVGWRLGGKTATGRGKCDRIEEHGIHILQGWYDTTFRFLRSIYSERKNKNLAPKSPLQDLFKDGLQANNTTLMTEFIPEIGKWSNWPLIFPTTEEQPGIGGPLDMWSLIKKGMAIILELILGSPYQKGINPISSWILKHFFSGIGASQQKQNPSFLSKLFKPLFKKGSWLLRLMHKEWIDIVEAEKISNKEDIENHHQHHNLLLNLIEKFIKFIEKQGLPYLEEETEKRHLTLAICFGYYNIKGIINDVYNPTTEKFDFQSINKYDYREWLSMQGAPEWLVHSVIVRFFYTGTFANLVNDNGGLISAGTALQFFAKSIGYKGSFVYQFVYGTGDVMVMPVYEVLKSRGVKFKFFHKIEQVHQSSTGSIESISYAEQVQLSVPEYDPTRNLNNLQTWPSTPNYEQLNPAQAAQLKADHVNLEDPWSNWTDVSHGKLLKGQDFDEVFLGIPIGTLKSICSEIISTNSTWQSMVQNVKTTPTQSAQLWFNPSLEELGFDRASWGLPMQNAAPNVVVYQNPMYSWLDSSLVLPHENWPNTQTPKFLAYFTGPFVLRNPLPDFTVHNYQEHENNRLMDAFEQWLDDNAAWFWPKGTTVSFPQGMNYQNLSDPDNSASGYDRFKNQFFRANVRPTDHYTLSVPNSDLHRLKPDQSGFDNLYLCGDWVNFGTNVGYIDGTIQSGQLAAQALLKRLGFEECKEIWH